MWSRDLKGRVPLPSGDEKLWECENVTRWEAFVTICSYLRAGLLGGHDEPKQNLSWELIIEVASFHYITPVLAWCLRRDESVPSDVRDYFEASLALNMERNRCML